MKQYVEFGELEHLVTKTPEQYSDLCDDDFVSAWQAFAKYWEIATE